MLCSGDGVDLSVAWDSDQQVRRVCVCLRGHEQHGVKYQGLDGKVTQSGLLSIPEEARWKLSQYQKKPDEKTIPEEARWKVNTIRAQVQRSGKTILCQYQKRPDRTVTQNGLIC